MKNLNNTQSDNRVYTVELDGFIYRGSYAYIQEKIAEWRENHD